MRGLLIGRFQPFHRGHLAVVQAVRARHPKEALVLGIGSAQESYTRENPFTAGERTEMIERGLAEANVAGCTVVPIPDIHQHALWVAHVAALIPPFERVYTNNPLTRTLFERASYRVEGTDLVDREQFEGTRIRAAMAADREWTSAVPPAVAAYLKELDAVGRMRLLAAEGDAAATRG